MKYECVKCHGEIISLDRVACFMFEGPDGNIHYLHNTCMLSIVYSYLFHINR